MVNKNGKCLAHCFSDFIKRPKHDKCDICNLLPNRYQCDDKFVVYKFTCNSCQKFYIGQTCRPFYLRYNEHKRSLVAGNNQSALSEHSVKEHNNQLSISDFNIEIMNKFRTPVETRISEAKFITEFNPPLNRREEFTLWWHDLSPFISRVIRQFYLASGPDEAAVQRKLVLYIAFNWLTFTMQIKRTLGEFLILLVGVSM